MAKKVVTLSAFERYNGKIQDKLDEKADASSVYTKTETRNYVLQQLQDRGLVFEVDGNGDIMPAAD